MQRREERIIQLEEELKHKIQEVARQLTQKEEEIMQIKIKFKDERMQLEGEKKKLLKDVSDLQDKIEQSHTRFYNLKKEVEESPLSVLRQELGSRQLEIGELQSKVKSANENAEDYKKKFEQVKRDMIQLKRQIDKEKEITLTKQAEELEQLKQMMRVKQAQDEERSQFDSLK